MSDQKPPSIVLLEAILAELKALNRNIVAMRPKEPIQPASDADLDSQRGNPQVKHDPRDWKGPPMKGRKYSECPAEFLDVLAGRLQWQAENPQPGKEKFASYDRLDCARALGWARRIRAGWKAPASEERAAQSGRSASNDDYDGGYESTGSDDY